MTDEGMLLPEIRGMFGSKGDSANWLDATSQFPNGVPRFNSRAECLAFMEEYNTYNGGSNPDNPQLMHIFTMLTSWTQVEKMLIPAIHAARKEPSFTKPVDKDYLKNPEASKATKNAYESEEAKNVYDAINFRLDQPIHRCTTTESTMNTLKYLFFHMKCYTWYFSFDG